MKVKPILFAFVLVILSIQNQIVGGEGSSNLDYSQYNDLVAIQVAGGKRFFFSIIFLQICSRYMK